MDLIALLVSSLAAAFERYAMQFYMLTISCDAVVTFFNGPKNEAASRRRRLDPTIFE